MQKKIKNNSEVGIGVNLTRRIVKREASLDEACQMNQIIRKLKSFLQNNTEHR